MEIKNIYGEVIFTAKTETTREAILEAVRSGANLSGADLSRANLSGANLSGANLSGANLSRADLSGANLSRANLSRANLSGANLSGADLSGANLSGANLSGANLSGANLSRANISGANLSGADLYGADLYGANLSGADLSGANLSGANLSGANLSGADLYGANLSGADLSNVKDAEAALAQIQFIPETGSFEAWKKCSRGIIVKLLIPEDAKRSHGAGRKCRCSKAIDLGHFTPEGVPLCDDNVAVSGGGYGVVEYVKGRTLTPTNGFDEYRWNICSSGIHFFLTRAEAVAYEL